MFGLSPYAWFELYCICAMCFEKSFSFLGYICRLILIYFVAECMVWVVLHLYWFVAIYAFKIYIGFTHYIYGVRLRILNNLRNRTWIRVVRWNFEKWQGRGQSSRITVGKATLLFKTKSSKESKTRNKLEFPIVHAKARR